MSKITMTKEQAEELIESMRNSLPILSIKDKEHIIKEWVKNNHIS